MGFLLERWSLRELRGVYEHEGLEPDQRPEGDIWQQVYGRNLEELEREWLYRLGERQGIEKPVVAKYLQAREAAKTAR